MMAFPSLALNALSGASGGSGIPGPPPITSGAVNDRSPINVAPVAVNLGAIALPFREGSVVNGGSGVNWPSRYIASSAGKVSFASASVSAPLIPAAPDSFTQSRFFTIGLMIAVSIAGFLAVRASQ